MGGSAVGIFGKTAVIGKLYYVRSTNETRVVKLGGGSFGDSRYVSYELWRQGDRAGETGWFLVVC